MFTINVILLVHSRCTGSDFCNFYANSLWMFNKYQLCIFPNFLHKLLVIFTASTDYKSWASFVCCRVRFSCCSLELRQKSPIFPYGSRDSAPLISIEVVASSVTPSGQSLKYQLYPFITHFPTLFHHTCPNTKGCLRDLYYLLPCFSSFSIPLLLKPERLSRSSQITSLWSGICFQSGAIYQASLGNFLSFSSSISLPFCPFSSFLSVSFLLGTRLLCD